MLKLFISHGKRLFSSKQNPGKQVPILTDCLHRWKQIIIVLVIALLVGYSQFREHFKCSHEGLDKTLVTNFCWVNGTRTVINESRKGTKVSHVGLGFTSSTRHRVIHHNYMRSLWLLLILLAAFSYFAQCFWASLFNSPILKAILKLSGSESSPIVKAAETARPYQLLSKIPRDDRLDESRKTQAELEGLKMTGNEKVNGTIELFEDFVTIYDQNLDYYPNQLTYLLLTKNSNYYKMSCLKLRRKLIKSALWSTTFSLLQMITPLFMIGQEYLLYGLNYGLEVAYYARRLITGQNVEDNTIDYELSSRIFPVATMCQFQQYSLTSAIESKTVQCTVAINEISSKAFFVIWWIVAVSIVVELISLIILLGCSYNTHCSSAWFGLRCWPYTRAQANMIASFRYRRSVLMKRSALIKRLSSSQKKNSNLISSAKSQNTNPASMGIKTTDNLKRANVGQIGFRAEKVPPSDDGQGKKWHFWGLRDICCSLAKSIVCCRFDRRRRKLATESDWDIDIYFLLYLLYLRLNKSKSRIEEVILMTEHALSNYLAELEAHCDQLAECKAEFDLPDTDVKHSPNQSLIDASKKIQEAVLMS